MIFAGPGGAAAATQLLQYYLLPGTTSGLGTYNIIIPVQSLQFQQNFNGSSNQFQVEFNRLLLDQPSPTGSSTVASPSPSSSPIAGASPSPAGSETPLTLATSAAQQTWNINFIVTDANGVPVDSMGAGGATDTSYSLAVNTTQSQTINYTKPLGAVVPSNPNAQLAGFTLINSP